MIRIIRSVVLVIAMLQSLFFPSLASAVEPQTAMSLSPTERLVGATESQLRICLDSNQRTKEVVDLVLLLDNSTSLNGSTTAKPTDPNESRFEAVESMLDAIGRAIEDSSARVNFGLITFAAQAEVRIPLGEEVIAAGTVASVARRIRAEAPSKNQKNGTNFVTALNEAFDVFERDSPSSHCRVLVWFTDGMFAHGGGAQETSRLLDQIPKLTCGVGGIAQRVRDLSINPFVILLKPSEDANPTTKSRSYELMQQVTGDRSLPLGFDVTEPSADCDQLKSPVGEVYDANNAGALAPYFVDIGRAVSGGQAVDTCPIPATGESAYQSPELPAARFLSWISLVVFNGQQLPSLSSLQVSSQGSVSAIETYFSAERSLTDYLFTPLSGVTLDKGWSLVASGGLDGACLRAKIIAPLTVTTTKSGGAAAQVKPDPNDPRSAILTPIDLDNIEFFDKGVSVSLEQLFVSTIVQEEITARIAIDPSGRIAPQGLTILVKGFSTEPQVKDCVDRGLSIPLIGVAKVGELERGKNRHEFGSTTCTVDLRFAKKNITVDATSLLTVVGANAASETSQNCRSLEPDLVVDGVVQDQLSVQLRDPKEYVIAVRLVSENKAFQCDVNSQISLLFQGLDGSANTKSVPLTIDIQRKVPPNQWLPIVLSLFAVLIAAFLSLLLLQILNRTMTSLPEDNKLYGYEIQVEVGIRGTGQVVALQQGVDVTKNSPQVKDLRPPKGSKDELSVHTMKLRRRVPGLFKPFTEPRAEVVGESDVVYRQRTSQGGLAVPFKQALILRPSRERPTDLELTSAILTVLVPRSGNWAGVAGVTRLIESQSFKEAVREFLDLRKSTSASEESMERGSTKTSVDSGTNVNPDANRARDEPKSAPQPPRTGRPPVPPPPPPRA